MNKPLEGEITDIGEMSGQYGPYIKLSIIEKGEGSPHYYNYFLKKDKQGNVDEESQKWYNKLTELRRKPPTEFIGTEIVAEYYDSTYQRQGQDVTSHNINKVFTLGKPEPKEPVELTQEQKQSVEEMGQEKPQGPSEIQTALDQVNIEDVPRDVSIVRQSCLKAASGIAKDAEEAVVIAKRFYQFVCTGQ